jgi:iron uptake system EfeUOB component EfeO/EfeM
MKNNFIIICALLIFGVAACEKKAEVPKAESPFKPTATIQELMISIVDPNVDPIWESIETRVTAAGVEEKHPKTDADWAVLKNHAIALREVTNLLLIDGRKVATSNTSTVAAELSPDEIEKLIAANRPAFIKNAHDLHEAVTQAIVAIDAKDVAALEATGGIIDQTCEKCHTQFWYPGDKRPTN